METNKLITDFQSGFRSNKCTIDNVFLLQTEMLRRPFTKKTETIVRNSLRKSIRQRFQIEI